MMGRKVNGIKYRIFPIFTKTPGFFPFFHVGIWEYGKPSKVIHVGQWCTQEKISGEFKVMAGLVGCPGGSPSHDGEFSKICKKYLKKIAKNPVFSPILQKDVKTLS